MRAHRGGPVLRLLRSAASALGCVLSLAAAAASQAAEDECRDCRYRGDLDALFLPATALGAGWELVKEAPVDPRQDPELRAAGVQASQALHYTRPFRGGAEVCSVEIWSFSSAEAARRARAGIEREAWRIGVQGNLLVMLHGVTLQRGVGFRPGLRPVCIRLAELTEAHAASLLLRAGPRAGAR
jgi:hypothetical protein